MLPRSAPFFCVLILILSIFGDALLSFVLNQFNGIYLQFVTASSMCTVVGVGVGTALSVQRKSAKYLALGGLAGTLGDAAYSFGYMCRDLQLEYSVARSQAYKLSKEEEKRRALENSARARGDATIVKGGEKS